MLLLYRYPTRFPLPFPCIETYVRAGFPSPAFDYTENPLDLRDYLIKHPAATFFAKVVGDSMVGAGIHSGDLLVIDRALESSHNKIVLAVVDGEFTVKRMKVSAGKIFLVAENKHYEPIEVVNEMQFEVWGVVTHVIHTL